MQWINVKDKLPEDDLPEDSKKRVIKCLVTINNGTIKPYTDKVQRQYSYKFNLKTQKYIEDWVWSKKGQNVTHWSYLPEPAKEF